MSNILKCTLRILHIQMCMCLRMCMHTNLYTYIHKYCYLLWSGLPKSYQLQSEKKSAGGSSATHLLYSIIYLPSTGVVREEHAHSLTPRPMSTWHSPPGGSTCLPDCSRRAPTPRHNDDISSISPPQVSTNTSIQY